MMPFDSTVQLDSEQKTLAARAMLAIAHVDGANTQEEVALIHTFFEAVTQGKSRVSFDELVADARKNPTFTADMFPAAGQKDLVIESCLMVAYADGALSAGEREAVATLSRQIGMSSERFAQSVELVQEYLLGHLAGLPDSPSVAKVGQEL